MAALGRRNRNYQSYSKERNEHQAFLYIIITHKQTEHFGIPTFDIPKINNFIDENSEFSIGNNKIILEINEECIGDIIDELYSPMVIATIKCIITVGKTFSSIFKKCEKSFDKIYSKWFDDNKNE